MKRTLLVVLVGLTSFVVPAAPARAALLTLDLSVEFSSGVDPEGVSPWVTATFDDSFGGANTVRLTMSNTNLVDQEFVSEWSFNFDPALDPTLLSIFSVDIGASTPGVSAGANLFKADGDGFFDILFDFPPPPGSFAAEFTAGEQVVFDLTYVAPISASSFDFFSVMGGGTGTYRGAAHVQAIGSYDDGSGWIGDPGASVPEPASAWLFGLLGLAVLRRRRA